MQKNVLAVIWSKLIVITSYSIHYTKLYETPALIANLLLVIFTSSKVLQIPFDIVHLNIFSPVLRPLTIVFGIYLSSKVADPTTAFTKFNGTASTLYADDNWYFSSGNYPILRGRITSYNVCYTKLLRCSLSCC